MIQITSLYKKYGKGASSTTALDDVNLTIGDAEIVAITGTSGAGKTTLLNIISGLESYETGSVKVNGVELTDLSTKQMDAFRGKHFGIVMQKYSLIDDFSVLDNVCLPLILTNSKCTKKERERSATEILSFIGIDSLSRKYVNELSGGEMQRVAIARALINKPKYILADEPTGALDHNSSMSIMKSFKMINDLGVGVIIVTHDMEIAQQCNRIIAIEDGRIISDTKTERK